MPEAIFLGWLPGVETGRLRSRREALRGPGRAAHTGAKALEGKMAARQLVSSGQGRCEDRGRTRGGPSQGRKLRWTPECPRLQGT